MRPELVGLMQRLFRLHWLWCLHDNQTMAAAAVAVADQCTCGEEQCYCCSRDVSVLCMLVRRKPVSAQISIAATVLV